MALIKSLGPPRTSVNLFNKERATVCVCPLGILEYDFIWDGIGRNAADGTMMRLRKRRSSAEAWGKGAQDIEASATSDSSAMMMSKYTAPPLDSTMQTSIVQPKRSQKLDPSFMQNDTRQPQNDLYPLLWLGRGSIVAALGIRRPADDGYVHPVDSLDSQASVGASEQRFAQH